MKSDSLIKDVDLEQKFFSWSEEQSKNFGVRPQIARHCIHELPLFTDAELLKIVENYPRSRMRVFTSGSNPENRVEEWQAVDTTGASGADILESVRVGRLWLNLQRIELVDRRFKELGDRLYAALTEQCLHFRPLFNKAFLFISSPKAMVYLHMDSQANMLWHIRGNKRMWIYPAGGERFVSRERAEEVCAGGEDDLMFKPEFDAYATVFDITAGDVVSWPPLSPHRVLNDDTLNVSLSTFHETPESYRRSFGLCANYYFRHMLPRAVLSAKETGQIACLKRFAYRLGKRVGLFKPRLAKEYFASFCIDPDAPLGIRPIEGGSVLTEHSRLQSVGLTTLS